MHRLGRVPPAEASRRIIWSSNVFRCFCLVSVQLAGFAVDLAVDGLAA
jgi:hypothetical protein